MTAKNSKPKPPTYNVLWVVEIFKEERWIPLLGSSFGNQSGARIQSRAFRHLFPHNRYRVVRYQARTAR